MKIYKCCVRIILYIPSKRPCHFLFSGNGVICSILIGIRHLPHRVQAIHGEEKAIPLIDNLLLFWYLGWEWLATFHIFLAMQPDPGLEDWSWHAKFWAYPRRWKTTFNIKSYWLYSFVSYYIYNFAIFIYSGPIHWWVISFNGIIGY